MTREDIIKLAREAGIDWHGHWNDDESNRLERFADLVAEQERKRWHKAGDRAIRMAINIEREACARVAEEWQLGVDDPRYQKSCADAIRARGQDPMPLFDDWDKDWTK